MWGGVGGGLIAYGFHFHLHCLHPGRLGVGWGTVSTSMCIVELLEVGGLGGVGGGLLAYGFHYHLHCLHPGRLGVGWGGWGVDSMNCHFHLHCLHPGRLLRYIIYTCPNLM